MMPLMLLLTSGCLGTGSDALFKDVAKRPPDAKPATIAALKSDRSFGEWVLYHDRLCDEFGCIK